MTHQKTAVILTNLGAPADNTRSAVAQFLRQSLSDERALHIPFLVRWIMLNLFILPRRAKKEFEAYQQIWSDEGSPLQSISHKQQQRLQQKLGDHIRVELMMLYGEPSISNVIQPLLTQDYRHMIVLPLFPQNCATTTGTTFDHIAQVLKKMDAVPELTFISDYHGDPGYINALAASIQEHWRAQQRQRFLLMSFHGLPQRNIDRGDPYYDQCMGTAHLLATILGLSSKQWGMSFQSPSGIQEWIRPYTSEVLEQKAKSGLREIDVVCPGFSTDCVQTLAEIQLYNREVFVAHGGQAYFYIPCLNEREDHIDMMAQLVRPHLPVIQD